MLCMYYGRRRGCVDRVTVFFLKVVTNDTMILCT